jgi:hypothetical protein
MGEFVVELLAWFFVASLRWMLALGKKPFSAFLDHDPEGSAIFLALAVALILTAGRLFNKVF